ncbi:MAG: hypothetical protein AAFP19_21405 [Bacteroidota bacterium]
MQISYALDEADHLKALLYQASQKKSVQKSRQRGHYIVPLVYLGLILILWLSNATGASIAFGLIALLWFLFYPQYSRNRYIKHYKNHIRESLSDRLGLVISLAILEDQYLLAKDQASESKVFIDQIASFTNLKSHFLIKLNSGVQIILPIESSSIKGDAPAFVQKIIDLSQKPVIDETNWVWK